MHQAGDTERIPSQLPRNGHGLSPDRTWPQPDAPPTDAGTTSRHRQWHTELLKWMISIGVLVVLAPPLLGLSLLGAIYWQARSDQTRPVDAIVVLGAAQYNGRPSPVLQARLDRALAVYKAGDAPYVIVTGGREPGDRFTEAETGRTYLMDHGVPSRAILMENNGRTSWQSMQAVATIVKAHHLHHILLVSDGFHLFRLKKMAHDLGLTAYASADKDSPIRPNSGLELSYAVRDAGALVAYMWHTR